jgi:glutathione synthase/RimK-type ligase-like ATP-grasp enzyme
MKLALLHADAIAPNMSKEPFFRDSYNASYARFIRRAEDYNIEVVIAPHTCYENGIVKSGWRYFNHWRKTSSFSPDAIFDRFAVYGDAYAADIRNGFRKRNLFVLNSHELDVILKDKMRTYEYFPSLLPPTVVYSRQDEHVLRAEFGNVHDDFTKEIMVMKPRRGSKSEGIVYCNRAIPILVTGSYIAQPSLKLSTWRKEYGELRVVVANHTPVAAYYRAPQGKFIARTENTAISLHKVDPIFLRTTSVISEALRQYGPSIYSIDMALGESGRPWVFELNGRTGQTWDVYENEQMIYLLELQQDATLKVFAQYANHLAPRYSPSSSNAV